MAKCCPRDQNRGKQFPNICRSRAEVCGLERRLRGQDLFGVPEADSDPEDFQREKKDWAGLSFMVKIIN